MICEPTTTRGGGVGDPLSRTRAAGCRPPLWRGQADQAYIITSRDFRFLVLGFGGIWPFRVSGFCEFAAGAEVLVVWSFCLRFLPFLTAIRALRVRRWRRLEACCSEEVPFVIVIHLQGFAENLQGFAKVFVIR